MQKFTASTRFVFSFNQRYLAGLLRKFGRQDKLRSVFFGTLESKGRMDPLHFCIAVGPISVYLLMLGLINLRNRPFLTTGARDGAALGIGIAGLVIAGPMELFFPEGAASQFGPFVWLLMLAFYGLCVSLAVLMMRSRLVIYNISAEQLRPILGQVAVELDPKSRWVGNGLVIPNLNVHLHMESVDWLRNIQLTSGGNQQSFEGWRKLSIALNQALQPIKVGPNIVGIGMLLASGVMAAVTATWMLTDQQAVARALVDMLRQ